MEHLAIDLGGRKSQICIRLEDGTIVQERSVPTTELGALLKKRPKSRVVMETCAEAFAVADQALMGGHEVRVVPATLVKSLGVGSRRTKNDRRDTRVLSEVSCRIDLPSVHIPSPVARERRSLLVSRDALVSARVKLVNCVRGWARTQLLQLPPRGMRRFASETREICTHSEKGLPLHIDQLLIAIEALTEQIELSDKQVAQLAKEDPVCQRLMTVPGVGPVTALRFVAALDDRRRFHSAHAVESYLGLVPGEHSSSERQERLGITKAGPASVRWVLVQAAWSMRRTRPDDPAVVWAAEVEKRRGRRVAIVGLARKLAGILFAIWRDESQYEARRGATASMN
jgi:transposase